MALKYARGLVSDVFRPIGLITTVSLTLFAGGCAQVGVPDLPSMLSSGPETGTKTASAEGLSPLMEATAYWGKKFQEHPRNLETALSYAKNLKAMGNKKQALAVLQRVSIFHGDSQELASEYGRLALAVGHVKVAEKVLARADVPSAPDWRVISARGAALAKQGQYAKAIPFFERALRFSKDEPSVLNNLALAHAMNGDTHTAETMLRQAASHGKATKKVRQNLALVLGLQGKYAEATTVSSRDVANYQAASDTKMLKKIVRLDPQMAPAPTGTQFAGALKPTMQAPQAAPQGWNTQVATTGQ